MGKPGMLQSTGLQRVGHDSVTDQQQKHYSYCPFPYEIRNSLRAESVLCIMDPPAPSTVPEIQGVGSVTMVLLSTS